MSHTSADTLGYLLHAPLLPLSIALALAACQPAHQAKPTSVVASTPIVRQPAQKLEIPVRVAPFAVQVPGTYVHQGTQLSLPIVAGPLIREQIIQYDRDGMDISANYIYTSGSRRLVMSVFIFPITTVAPKIMPSAASTQGTCDQIALATASMAETVFGTLDVTTTKRIAEGPVTSPLFPGKPGYMVVLELRQGQVLNSELHLFCGIDDVWLVQYRITYPAELDAQPLIRAFGTTVPRRATAAN